MSMGVSAATASRHRRGAARAPAFASAPAPAPASPSAFPEIDCVRARLAAPVVAAAEGHAERVAVGADQVLIARGVLDEEEYLDSLCAALGSQFEKLDGTARTRCPLDDSRLIECTAVGMLPLMSEDTIHIVVAPRGTAVRRIMQLASENSDWPKRFHFTTPRLLDHFVLRCGGKAMLERACESLKQDKPVFSAATRHWREACLPLALLASIALGVAVAPAATTLTVQIALAGLFMAWLGLRLSGALMTARAPAPLEFRADADLPVYTVIVALYREAASVNPLLRAIGRLDYPPEKLDVILAVEADDHDTRNAIERRETHLPVRVIPVPKAEPRTKPKALNIALPFARGHFTVVYDAEDRPDPDQLRRALQAFSMNGTDLACVQARLCIDNTDDSWLTRLFTAEYAAQFDVFLDALARWKLPLPLGGSSNHFHTAALREIGAWDPYNVTEDADLGMRLARFGYRAAMIDSTTYEEAPARVGPWLRQRTRWFKGWMQTWTVHVREPRRLLRELGPAGFLAFQLVVGGNVLAALIHPLFLAGLIVAIAHDEPFGTTGAATGAALAMLYGITAFAGYLSSALLGWLGLKRRGLLRASWALMLTPVNWLLLSLAAWRALYQFAVAPYAWEKTEHGLARTSRRDELRTEAVIELEACLRRLKSEGALAQTSDAPSWKRPRGARGEADEVDEASNAARAGAAVFPRFGRRFFKDRARNRFISV